MAGRGRGLSHHRAIERCRCLAREVGSAGSGPCSQALRRTAPTLGPRAQKPTTRAPRSSGISGSARQDRKRVQKLVLFDTDPEADAALPRGGTGTVVWRCPPYRSENIARIRGTGTRPETVLAAAHARAGIAVITKPKVDGVRADLVLAGERHLQRRVLLARMSSPLRSTSFQRGLLVAQARREHPQGRRQTIDLEVHGWKVVWTRSI